MRYPRAGAPAFIYAVRRRSDGAIKLGATHDLSGRARRLGAPLDVDADADRALLAVWRADAGEEQALHQRFAAYRLDGEWFRPSAALERLVTLNGGQGDRRVPAPRALASDLLHRAARVLGRATYRVQARADALSLGYRPNTREASDFRGPTRSCSSDCAPPTRPRPTP